MFAALQMTTAFAQTGTVSWSAGGSVAGNDAGVRLVTSSTDSPVGAPTSISAPDSTGATVTKSVTTAPSNSTCGGCAPRYLYFDVSTTGYSFAKVEIDYYDDPALAGQALMLQYDAPANAFTPSDPWYPAGTGTFQTARWDLSNVGFTNREPGGSDFRLMDLSNTGVKVAAVRVTGSNSATAISINANPVTWTAGPSTAGTATGLSLRGWSDSPLSGTLSSVTVAGVTKSATTMPAAPADTVRYLYFDADTGAFGTNSFAKIEVEYYDDPALVGSRLRVQYDARAGAYTNSDYFFLSGTGLFQTATFHLTDTRFANGENANSDFRLISVDGKGIKVTKVTVTSASATTRPASAASVSYDLSRNPAANGLQLRPFGDGVTTVTSATNDGRAAVKVSSAGYMYFDVDDGFIFQGSSPDAQVEVSFFDKGYGFFYLVYDGLPATTSSERNSFGPDVGYSANNIVYLQNTGTWKTYKFNLSNVYFGNRLLNGVGDIKVAYPKGSNVSNNYDLANQGYELLIDRVTVTKSTNIDVAGTFEGNYAGFGAPAWVWTQLTTINEQGHGVRQDESQGATTVVDAGGKTARKASSGKIAFNINDNYLKDGKDANGVAIATVLIGVEYFDSGTGNFTLEYDGTGGTASLTVPLRATNTWKRQPFYITNGRFNNGLDSNDFRILSPTNDLVVRDVIVSRTPGDNRTGVIPFGYSRTQRVVGVHYFPVFDGYRPNLWETSTIKPSGTGADNYDSARPFVNTSYSYRSIETNKKDLTDMRDSGIDFLLDWFTGNLEDMNTHAVASTKQLVAAAEQVENAPKFALLLDPVHIKVERLARTRTNTDEDKLDLSNAATRGQIVKMAEDYFSLVPRSRWATIENRPIIALYYQGSNDVSVQDPALIDTLIARFQATHGVRPYIIADRLYDPSGTLALPVDEYFSWGAALCDSCLTANPGFSQASVFEVGPGFLDTGSPGHPARSRNRESGAFYSRAWDRAIAKGNHMVLIDTFNYFVEGSGISETSEFGRQYLDLTKTKVAAYKARNYETERTVTATLGNQNTFAGVMQDDVIGAGITTAGARGGRTAVGNAMFFSVDDSFIWNSNPGAVTIRVEYLDSGTNLINVKYRAVGGQQKIAMGIDVRNSNTGQFKTAEATVSDALFDNGYTYANDILIDTDVTGGMTIRSITIIKPATYTLPTLPNGWVRSYMPVGPRNLPGGW